MIFGIVLLFVSIFVRCHCLSNYIEVAPEKSLNALISKHPIALIAYYNPKNNECEEFKSIISDVADKLKNIHVKVILVEDAEENSADKHDFGEGLKIKYSFYGKLYDYEGLLEENDIFSVMNSVYLTHKDTTKVHKLTDKNIDDFITQNKYVFIVFFSPLCVHCKDAMPIFQKAAKILANRNPAVLFASLDCIEYQDMISKFGINKYPSFFLFKNRKIKSYEEERSAKGFVEWLEKNIENEVTNVQSYKEFRYYKSKTKITMLGVFKSYCSSLFNTFVYTARFMNNNVNTIISNNADVLLNYRLKNNMSEDNILLLMPEYFKTKYEPEYFEYEFKSKNVTTESINEFVDKNIFPLLGEYKSETKKLYDEKFGKKFLCTFYFSVDFSKHHNAATQTWIQTLASTIVDYKDDIRFAIANDEKYESKMVQYGLGETGEDINLGCINTVSDKFGMEPNEFDKNYIKSFLDSLIAGKTWPFVRSMQIPKQSESIKLGYLGEIVGSTYRSIVNDNPDMLLIAILPDKRKYDTKWCENAKILAKKVAPILYKYKISIGFIDLTFNDIPMAAYSGLTLLNFQEGGLFAAKFRPESASVPVILKKTLIKCVDFPDKEENIFKCARSRFGVPVGDPSTKDEL